MSILSSTRSNMSVDLTITNRINRINKIIPIGKLAEVLNTDGVVKPSICDGVFDLLHIGHIRHLQQAKTLGPVVVLLASDAYVHKGPNSPVYPELERAEMLSSLNCVDYISVVGREEVANFLRSYGPVVYVKGEDYRGRENSTVLAIQDIITRKGGFVFYTEGKPYSSTRINNEYYSRSEWCRDFRSRYLYDDIQDYLNRCIGLTSYVVGEPIHDVYIRCTPVGKSAKDSMVVHELVGSVGKFNGGADIVAEHLQGLTGYVTVHGSLPKIRKHRYVDGNSGTKLFGIDTKSSYTKDHRKKILSDLEEMAPGLLVVADFGHGLITKNFAVELSQSCQYVCATVQSNAMNWGFNLATKYRDIHYLVLDEMEARLADCDNESTIDNVALSLMQKLNPTCLAITQGSGGVSLYRRSEDMAITSCHVPSFATNIIDTIGAGDAFLAWTSPLAVIDAPLEVIGFIGNIAAGIHVGVVGNSEPVRRDRVNKWVGGLLG